MPSLIDILLPEKVKTSQVIPQELQQYVYPFTRPIFKCTSTFARLEQITTIHGCRVMNVVSIVEEETIMKGLRKTDALTLHIMLHGHSTWFSPFEGKVPLSPGEYNLLKMTAGTHDILLKPGVSEFIQLDIPATLIADILPASPLVRSLLAANVSCQSPVSAQPIEQKFYALINEIRQTPFKEGMPQLRRYAQLTELITAAIDNLERADSRQETADPAAQLVHNIKEYLNHNLNKRITLSQLSTAFYISESKLKQDFKRYQKKTVLAYLQEKRMQQAMRRLKTSDNKISQIALEAGYSNLSSFTREFRKHYACSPRTVRTNTGSL
jgi:AraC-like DNA-binding protein